VYKIHKFRDITEVQNFLNGGLLGTNVSKGVVGLVGLQLTFTSPVGVVTFAPGAGPDPSVLSFKDIKTQVEAAVAGVRVYQIGGQIAFIDKADPIATPIALAAGDDAKKLFGFPTDGPVAGRIINDANSVVPPRFEWWNNTNDGVHAIMVWEG